MKTDTQTSTFESDIVTGLQANPKRLSSKYFYDKRGSELFEQIMRTDSYYLTRAEYQLFQTEKARILQHFSHDGAPFRLVELGAGDGVKTKILLRHFLEAGADFRYLPIDISGDALQRLEKDLNESFPELHVEGKEGDYFRMLDQLHQGGKGTRKVVMFLGSNIGNFTQERAESFLAQVRSHLHAGDQMLIGFDLKKDPATILAAYNDPEGITEEFNLNLLRRINRELDGNFDTDRFLHAPTYNPMTGATKSYLVSRESQEVHLKQAGVTIHFDAWEAIDMELSQKYDLNMIEAIADDSGFRVREHLFDEQGYYTDSIWEAC
jgi:L-histidine N-alpha-methyltransferase